MNLPYLAHFGLKEEPFSTVPSPRYLFLTPMHATALTKSQFIVEARKGLTVIFGEPGMGKSTLARLLHQKFLDAGFVSVLLTNPHYPTPNALLRTIIQEFQLPRTARAYKDNLDLLKAHLYDQAITQGRTVVLILDEAQTLRFPSLELLRQLINYETNEQKLVQVLIFAQEEFRAQIRRHAYFRDRIASFAHLRPLRFRETRALINFRVRQSHRRPEEAPELFTLPALWLIHRHTAGYPRRIIMLCSQLLLAFIVRQSGAGPDVPRKIGASLVLSCVRRVFH